MDEQIKILNDERLRLVEGVNAGILSSESVNQRMLEINKIIEDMIKNKDKNPFDKMFPGQSLTMNKGGEARSFPDLTGDGKVTQADILKGRGVKMANGGEIDMARRCFTWNNGYASTRRNATNTRRNYYGAASDGNCDADGCSRCVRRRNCNGITTNGLRPRRHCNGNANSSSTNARSASARSRDRR